MPDLADSLGGAQGRPTRRLTAREEQIATLVAQGGKDKEIAAALGISPLTVATHLRHIYSKVGVHARAAMVAQVLRRGEPTHR